MREIARNSYEFITSTFSGQGNLANRIADDRHKREQEQELSINRAIGSVVLADYHRGNPIYEDLLPQFKDSMIQSGLKVADLGLPDETSRQISNLTGLE